jgi:hypothetical protein
LERSRELSDDEAREDALDADLDELDDEEDVERDEDELSEDEDDDEDVEGERFRCERFFELFLFSFE